jgi:hypothetical protein
MSHWAQCLVGVKRVFNNCQLSTGEVVVGEEWSINRKIFGTCVPGEFFWPNPIAIASSVLPVLENGLGPSKAADSLPDRLVYDREGLKVIPGSLQLVAGRSGSPIQPEKAASGSLLGRPLPCHETAGEQSQRAGGHASCGRMPVERNWSHLSRSF